MQTSDRRASSPGQRPRRASRPPAGPARRATTRAIPTRSPCLWAPAPPKRRTTCTRDAADTGGPCAPRAGGAASSSGERRDLADRSPSIGRSGRWQWHGAWHLPAACVPSCAKQRRDGDKASSLCTVRVLALAHHWRLRGDHMHDECDEAHVACMGI